MKRLAGTVIAFCFTLSLAAQFTLKGTITSEAGNLPVESATVSLLKNNKVIDNAVSDAFGRFSFRLKQAGEYQLQAQHISMQTQTIPVLVSQSATNVQIALKQSSYYLEPLEVRSVRAGAKAPFTKTDLNKAYIEKNNLGQDLPFLLDQTPSVVVNSDAGNGVGYTNIRIRGSDASRINVTVNGIPYNDAESQGTFFVDLPDVASSLNGIQVQRGAGTSSNGAGAFGATIALSTNEFINEPYAELNNTYGSFNTWKNTVKVGSGLLADHFTIDARLSRLSSDGYIDRASSNLRSFYFSTAWMNKNSSLRLNVISGTEKTYQAWNGVPESLLATNRTYNSAGTEKPGEPYDNETDNYQQDHYQLFFNHSFHPKWSFNTAAFLTRGKGYYEQYKADQEFASFGVPEPVINGAPVTETDLVRQLWLDNYFYGQILSLRFKNAQDELTIGGGWNRYDGQHYGKVPWAQTGFEKDYQYYLNDAFKTDVNVYAKWQHSLSEKWQTFADVQYRGVRHQMNGFRDNPAILVDRRFNFINPKAGLTYSNHGLQAYVSYALANKEPNRDDFEAGVTQQPTYETLHNVEAGVQQKYQSFSYGANLYYMNYNNQLVLTGKINDVGAYTRVNIPESYRLGVELQASATFSPVVNVAANMAFSRNKIRRFTEFLDDYDDNKQNEIVHENTDISFSPNVVGGATLNVLPLKNVTVGLISKYVGRQYLDNTQDKLRSLKPYYLQDVRLQYQLSNKLVKQLTIIAQVNNVFNKMYAPNGYTFSYVYGGAQTTENYYFPMAGTNAFVALNIKL